VSTIREPLDAVVPPVEGDDADLERRFGGLRRLYGDAAYARIRAAHVVVVGVGGVGSWAAEALARSGVAMLTLIDLDHVAESNINRQVQALGATLGQAKVEALAARIADIHPGCRVIGIEEFVAPGNWPGLIASGPRPDAVIDACDQVRAKATLAAWALATGVPLMVVGAAGGKRHAEGVRVSDLAEVTHDPMLASLRQRLRRHHGASRAGPMSLRCVHSTEPVRLPEGEGACDVEANLACHGYGSNVAVTATFGMVAAGCTLESVASATTERLTRPHIIEGLPAGC
jgi:tRNA A37 threonylcarbamoyladenosine dehydratase